MTELGKLRRDADTLIESLQRDWRDIADPATLPEARELIRIHIQWCLDELSGLWKQIEQFNA